MKSPLRSGVFLLVVLPGLIWPQNAVPKKGADALNRTTPRSAVTSFLQACDSQNYDQAAHYLDLRNVPERVRAAEGPELAKELELALNSNSHFDVLRLSDKPEGNLADDPNPQLEHITTITRNVGKIAIDLNQVTEGGSQVWLFSPATVAAIPTLATTSTPSSLENHLPHFLVATLLLETPLWKWAALVILAVIILSLLRLAGHLVVFLVGRFFPQFATSHRWLWVQAVVGPSLVFLSAITFALGEQFIDPSALSRLYIARVLLLVVVFSFSWCLINLVDLFLTRIDSFLDPRQRIVSHSLSST